VTLDLDRVGREYLGADCPRCGRDACEGDCIEGRQARPSVPFSDALSLLGGPRPRTIIEGIAWAGRKTVLVSESTAGKTFLLWRLAAAVGEGQKVFGRRTHAGSVASISFEGDALGLRIQALNENGYTMEHVYVRRSSEPISPRIGRDGIEMVSIGEALLVEALAVLAARLQAEGRPPIVLIIIDTIRASMSGSEDSSEDVSAYLRAVDRIIAPYPDAAAILAHHSGWQDGEVRRRRERGSSAFRGNCDATLYLEVSEEDVENHRAYLTLSALKVRDDERPAPLRLVRQRVELAAINEHGETLTSCIIERDPRTNESIEATAAAAKKMADEALASRALDIIGKNKITSITDLRVLLECAQAQASETLARLRAEGLITRDSQRESYRVVLSRTPVPESDSSQSYRTPPPKGSTSTTRRKGTNQSTSRTASRTGRRRRK
jgi:AAA domain